MAAILNDLYTRGKRMYLQFTADVIPKWITLCHRMLEGQRGPRNVRHTGLWNSAELDANIYFEIVCFGAFSLSMYSTGYVSKKGWFSKTFDRSAWAEVDTGISSALYSDIAKLYSKFPGQSRSQTAAVTPVQAAQLAFIGYKQHITDYDAGADMLILSRYVRSPEKGGCNVFSTRLSDSIDLEFQIHWTTLAQQIVDSADSVVKEEFQTTV